MIESNIRKDIEKKIDLYVEGKLSPKEIDDLWAELIQDEYYFDYLKTVASLKGLSVKSERAKIFTLSPFRKWSAAAAVVLIAGTLALFSILNNNQTVVEPLASIELDYYRSAEGTVTEADSSTIIMQSITAANRGDINGALSLIDQGLESASDNNTRVELLITAGSIYYNNSRYEEAAEHFENALEIPTTDTSLLERGYWYLGNTYFQLNEISKARSVLEKASELNGSYSRVAQSYLRALSD